VAAVSLPVIRDPEARREFDQGYDWYEEQRAGLGEAFADQVQVVFDRIAKMPQLHQKVLKEVRRAVVRRFPYCIFYREEPDRIRVISVFHARRNPKEWQRRV
jgi:plasmid stabilization system protein ParE